MKTKFFKNVLPFAVMALAISGAFVTTSMQKASKDAASRIGYALNPDGSCSNILQNCETVQKPFACYIGGGTSGVQAYGKNAGNCVDMLWRP